MGRASQSVNEKGPSEAATSDGPWIECGRKPRTSVIVTEGPAVVNAAQEF